MARNLDVSLLRAFVAVVDAGGMTAAGGILNLTQAAVSQQIKRLEETFGAELIARDRRGMRLTPAGERLFGRAKRLLSLNDEIWTEMTTPVYEGEVRLGIPHDIVTTYLPMFLKSFAQAYPKVNVTLECKASAPLLEMLHAGKLDLTITTELECGPGGEILTIDRLVWVGARGGEAAWQRPLPIAIGCSDCAWRDHVRGALDAAGIAWRAVSDVTNADAQTATTAADVSVMTLLASSVPADLEVLGGSANLPALPNYSINLYLPKNGSSQIARELARYIRGAILERRRVAA